MLVKGGSRLNQPIASFVVRFHIAHTESQSDEKQYRIKVTHVQDEIETTFESFEEAMKFMKMSVEHLGISS